MKSEALYKISAKGSDENSDLKKLFFDFVNIWPVVLVLIFVFLLAAVYVNKTTAPTYQVQATIVIKQDKNPVSKELFESIGLKTSDNIENEISILRSFTLAHNTLKELDFNVEYYRENFWQDKEVYNSLPYKVEVDWEHQQLLNGRFDVKILSADEFQLSLKKSAFALYDPSTPDQPIALQDPPFDEGKYKFNSWITGQKYRFRIVKMNKTADNSGFAFKLRSNYNLAVAYSRLLQVQPQKKESTILSLSLESTNVEKARKYVNKIIEVYQARELMNKNLTATNTASFINEQLKSIKDSLLYFEDQLQRFRSNNQSFNVEEQSNLALSRLAGLEDEQSKISLKLKYYESVLSYLEKEQINQLVVPSAVGIEESVLGHLISELIQIQNDRLRLNQFLSGDNRTLKDLNFRYSSTLNTLKESLKRSSQTARLSLTDINKRISSMSGQLSRMPKVERNLLSIKRQAAISENIYTYLLQKRNEAEISRASNIPSSETLDMARRIGGMLTPKPLRNYAIALSLALLLPLLFLFLRNIFDNKIYESKLLESKLNVPLIGTIARSRRKANNNIVFDHPKAFVSENFRNIRANTQFLHPGDTSMVIAFTSSVSGEGKTFCSVNTAAIYALGGKKTILVGLDLRRPKIAEDFDLPNDVGVSNYLTGKYDLNGIVKKTVHDNLDVLLSGPIPPNPAELIGSTRFLQLIEELRAEYEVIILDCPPESMVSETIDIFHQSDLTFYIFRHMYSDWDAVENLNNLIDKGLIKKAYAIYNDVRVSEDYGYGYGYGVQDEKFSLFKKLKKKLTYID